MSDQRSIEVPADGILKLLEEKAKDDPTLTAQLEAAKWQVIAIALIQERDNEGEVKEEDGE